MNLMRHWRREMIKRNALPNGWLSVVLGETIDKIPAQDKKIKQKDYLEFGQLPIIDQGQEFIGGYTDDISKRIECDLPVVVFGDHTKIVKLIPFPFAPGADGVKIIKPLQVFDPKLFAHFVQVLTKKILDRGYARHFQFIEKSEIPLPPLAEQYRIVAKIEELFSDLDDGIASLKKAQAQFKTYRQAVLKYAFEGKLTAAWRQQHQPEPAEKLLAQTVRATRRVAPTTANGKTQKPKELPPLTEAELAALPQLPEGWRWVKIGELTDIKLGKMLSKKAFENELDQRYYLRNQNIQWGYIDFSDLKMMGFSENEFERYSVQKGDLLVCEGGEPGRCAVYRRESPIMYQKALHRVRVSSLLNVFYVNYCLTHLIQNKVTVGEFKQTTIQHLPLVDFLQMPIPFCSIIEQHQIVQEIESRLSVCDKLEESLKDSLQKAEALRQSILKKAFAGKLVPQDPNDEPAEKLLERIRAEKATAECKL